MGQWLSANSERGQPISFNPPRVQSLRVNPQRGQPFSVNPLRGQPFSVNPLRVQSLRVNPERGQPFSVNPLRVQSLRVTPQRVQSLRVNPQRGQPISVNPLRASLKEIVLKHMPEGYHGWDTKLIPVSKDSQEYNSVLIHLNLNMKSKVSRIVKVHCPSLHGWYMMKKAEYESRGLRYCEKTLLHVTGASKIQSILRSNLNWRRVHRHKFGKGTSFSNDAAYANKYAAMEIGLDRALIVADVLVGRTYPGSAFNSLPPKGYDTTTGNNHVYVKFHDDEFLPKYIVYYTSSPIVRRRFNRYMY